MSHTHGLLNAMSWRLYTSIGYILRGLRVMNLHTSTEGKMRAREHMVGNGWAGAVTQPTGCKTALLHFYFFIL